MAMKVANEVSIKAIRGSLLTNKGIIFTYLLSCKLFVFS